MVNVIFWFEIGFADLFALKSMTFKMNYFHSLQQLLWFMKSQHTFFASKLHLIKIEVLAN